MMQTKKLQELLDWSDGSEVYEGNLLEKVDSYHEIIIFGAGIGGRQTLELLRAHNEEGRVRAFCDNNEMKTGACYLGLPVMSSEEMTGRWPDALVIISSTAYDVIKEQ